ncbi:MAG: hypothetical protein SGJ13_01500 [Actinomycetota bacterium]|nr:hypothetical protein [Actinomycetota bacterium]
MQTTTLISHLPARIAGAILTTIGVVLAPAALHVWTEAADDGGDFAFIGIAAGVAGVGIAAAIVALGVGLLRAPTATRGTAFVVLLLPLYATTQWHGASLQAPLIAVIAVPLLLLAADFCAPRTAQ